MRRLEHQANPHRFFLRGSLPVTRTEVFALTVAAAIFGLTGFAQAQDVAQQAEALIPRDAERARQMAQTAIEGGTRDGSELAPLYRVLAVAAGRAGDEEGARRAFLRALALDPELRLDRSAPPEVRSPYMEARGQLDPVPVQRRLLADVELAADLSGVVVRISDPAQLAARVRLRTRLAGGQRFIEVVRPPAEEIVIPIDGLEQARAIDYSIGFLDEYGNRVWTRGSDTTPEHLEAPQPEVTVTPSVAGSAVASTAPASPPSPTGYYAGGGVLIGLGVVGLIVGGVATAQRERLAGIVNEGYPPDGLFGGDPIDDVTYVPRCTGTGTTHTDVCAPQLSELNTWEATATAMYVVGSVLMVAGIVVIAVAPHGSGSESQASLECVPSLGISCTLRY